MIARIAPPTNLRLFNSLAASHWQSHIGAGRISTKVNLLLSVLVERRRAVVTRRAGFFVRMKYEGGRMKKCGPISLFSSFILNPYR
jgi:hypothetical protein